MEETNKISKKIMAIGSIVVIVAGIILAIVLWKNSGKSYRIVKVYEIDGATTVTREKKGEMDAYANMVLQSADEVFVKQGTLTLKLDDDKYVYGEENTRFELVAEGNSANSKTSLHLLQGAITNEIQNPLSKESSYEVHTQNSNMSVRGTIYRTEVYTDEKGVVFTKLSVFKGQVSSRLIDREGNLSNDEVLIQEGKEILAYDDGMVIDYYSDVQDIDYSKLPTAVLKFLKDKMEKENLSLKVSSKELEKMIRQDEGPFTVTFQYKGSVFGTQTVERDGVATQPVLMPAPSGSWDFDFSKSITEDTVIEWK